MRKIIFLLTVLSVFANGPLYAEATVKQTTAEPHNVFKGLMLKVWYKLRAVNPKQNRSAKSDIVYTAGIRGAEATDTLIQPYWKGDLSKDENFQKELKAFTDAQQLLDNGKLTESVQAFEKFLESYPDSNLSANALFAKSLSDAGLGKTQQAADGMQKFIDRYPSHPLVGDAKQIIEHLKKPG